MHELKTCSECKRQLSLDLFYKRGDRLDAKCSDCIKEKKRRIRQFKRLSKAGNAKRICSLKQVKRSTIDYGTTQKNIQLSLVTLFKSDSFELGVKV